MRRFGGQGFGVAQGARVLFSDYANDGPMWSGAGARESRHTVRFDEAFREAPVVMIGISMWDLDRETNVRADIAAEEISRDGFTIVFRTWGDTRVARIRANWTAFGEIADDEVWDV